MLPIRPPDGYTLPAWERQPCDLDEERWCAFLAWLDLPRPRTRHWRRLGWRTGRSIATLKHWAQVGLWEPRAEAWEADSDRAAATAERAALVAASVDAARTVYEEQIPIYAKARRLVELGLVDLLDQAEQGAVSLTPRELMTLASIMLPAERALRENEAPPSEDVSDVADEELRRVAGF